MVYDSAQYDGKRARRETYGVNGVVDGRGCKGMEEYGTLAKWLITVGNRGRGVRPVIFGDYNNARRPILKSEA